MGERNSSRKAKCQLSKTMSHLLSVIDTCVVGILDEQLRRQVSTLQEAAALSSETC